MAMDEDLTGTINELKDAYKELNYLAIVNDSNDDHSNLIGSVRS